jgi:hypothetical protein
MAGLDQWRRAEDERVEDERAEDERAAERAEDEREEDERAVRARAEEVWEGYISSKSSMISDSGGESVETIKLSIFKPITNSLQAAN